MNDILARLGLYGALAGSAAAALIVDDELPLLATWAGIAVLGAVWSIAWIEADRRKMTSGGSEAAASAPAVRRRLKPSR